MSRKVVQKLVCDLCLNEVDRFHDKCYNDSISYIKMSFVTYYGGEHKQDMCFNCFKKIEKFLLSEFGIEIKE